MDVSIEHYETLRSKPRTYLNIVIQIVRRENADSKGRFSSSRRKYGDSDVFLDIYKAFVKQDSGIAKTNSLNGP